MAALVERIMEWCAEHRISVFAVVLALCAWALVALRETPLDAVPDLSDPQVIVFTDWMGRSPDLVEDQITYPLVRALQSTPSVRTVRGYSMFGMSFIYVIFGEGTDIYWGRTRVLEQLGRVQGLLPPGVAPTLGPDATGVGWVFQYVLEDTSGHHDLAELRTLQDFTIRPALQAVSGVAEVASLGGFQRQYQVVVDPQKLLAFNLTIQDVAQAVGNANAEVGGRVAEQGGREYVIRGRGYARTLDDFGQSLVGLGPGGTPVRISDVASVRFGPEIRRGATDMDGRGEAVGGIVVMRVGQNALNVIEAVKEAIAELHLPDGIHIKPTYDRSELILGSIATLRTTLLEEGVVVALVCILFLVHIRSAVVAILMLPLAVLLAFIPMRYLGLTANLMSLGGIAIAIGELSDAAIVLIENAHVRLAEAGPGADRKRVIIDAAKEVGPPIFFSLLIITVSFLPIFTLAGQAGRLFRPLAFTKTFAMLAASILSITLAPPLMVLLIRGRIRKEEENPVSRVLRRVYEPIARWAVRRRVWMVGAAALVMVGTVPVYLRLGSEFMPPLNEGSLLVMPTTFPGISIEEARRALTAQDRIIRGFAEVRSVHGKAGRAETPTDPAQLDMIETVIELHPTEHWPQLFRARWYSGFAPAWLKRVLGLGWPEYRTRTLDELSRDISDALRMPGYQMAVSPPIRTRIDMLTTGVRTPVGVKVLGTNLAEIERISLRLEGLLRGVSGTRSVFAERQTGREYIDITPNRRTIARYGLTMRDVQDVVDGAIGGMPVSTVIDGRARFPVNVRLGQDFRRDPQALRDLLVAVTTSEPVGEIESLVGGAGSAGSETAGMGGGGGMGSRKAGAGMSTGMGESGTGSGSPAMAAAAGGMAGSQGTASGMSGATGSDYSDRFRPQRAAVPLGVLADVRVVTGPPMIKDENGVLAGYVFADVDTARRDLGGWVTEAKARVKKSLALPPGFRLVWTGQYEFMAEMEARMRYVLPLTLVLIVILLHMSMQGWQQTALVLLSLPSAVAGSLLLLWARKYNLSTAVWVGLVAVGGVAAETGTVMIVYLDEAIARRLKSGQLKTPADVDAAVIEGASQRVRPLLMTVATTVIGLLPLLWESGVGADVSARTAAPVVGGLWSCMFLTLLVLPASYAMWRRYQLAQGRLVPTPEASDEN